MKLDIRAFAASFTIITAVFSMILFIWCAANGFGSHLVFLFESVHPSGGFSIIGQDKSFLASIPGIFINTLYAALDAFIFSFLFALVYNFIAADKRNKKA